ncbi:MAG: ClpXP protease specificity-enhancing factor [Gammaproteobacteria bacterium]|nr:ClpXP protease specificity-enhancing factor [Gammaproteobacteria bacterium]MBT7308496.1 ClpXP protease specificity-enhancing factor [Gammaproteobacteria bacterium]
MSSSRPYMIRAIHAWISDNGLTPYIVVDANHPMTTVPTSHINDGKIVLNCGYDAVSGLSIENDWISFGARFSGVSETLSFPPEAVSALYARENGQGMIFPEEENREDSSQSLQSESPLSDTGSEGAEADTAQAKESAGKNKPTLKLVK